MPLPIGKSGRVTGSLFHHSWNSPHGNEAPLFSHPERFHDPLRKIRDRSRIVDAIQSRCLFDLFRDEAVHRTEHSVEFQCLFLRFLYPEPAPLKIVPVLCGSFHESIEQGRSPAELKPFRQFVDALAESVSRRGEKVCYIAMLI